LEVFQTLIMKKLILFLLFIPLLGYSQICSPPSASASLDIGNVQATILNGGDFYFDGQTSTYLVPKSDPSTGSPGVRTMFGGGIWLSALTSSNNLKVTAMTYRNQGFEFYPGPIDNISGVSDFGTCNYFDQIWEVLDIEVQQHINLTNNSTPVSINQINSHILNWPGKGNSHLGTITIPDELAPFVDLNNNNIYEPEYGDYPKIQGDQALFWVMNDIGGPNEVYGGQPLKVQVQMLAYAYQSGLLVNTTIYECKVFNKSFGNLHDFRFGLFLDPDLPPSTSNYVGCDTIRQSSFSYLGNINSTISPVNSVTFLNQEMNSFNFFINSGPLQFQDPSDAIEVNNFLHAKHANGTPFSDPGVIGFIPITYYFPGDPDDSNSWSMNNSIQTSPADFRTLQTSGPHDLNAWTSFDISWAVHTSFPDNYSPNDFYDGVSIEIDSVQDLFDNFNNTYDHSTITGVGSFNQLDDKTELFPNPSHDFIELSYEEFNLKSIDLYSIDRKLITHDLARLIDIRDLNSGIYILEIVFEEGTVIKKFVKN
jgi:hypothetical protein